MRPSSPVLVRGWALSWLVGLAIAFPGASAFAATPDLDAIRQQVEAQHDEAVKRLKDWIAMPSIAAENLNSREGAQYMAQLASDAGFPTVEIIDTDGKPGVFVTLAAGAEKTVGLYFMSEVKPRTEASRVGKEGGRW